MRKISKIDLLNNSLLMEILKAYEKLLNEENADLSEANLCNVYNSLLQNGRLNELRTTANFAIDFFGMIEDGSDVSLHP